MADQVALTGTYHGGQTRFRRSQTLDARNPNRGSRAAHLEVAPASGSIKPRTDPSGLELSHQKRPPTAKPDPGVSWKSQGSVARDRERPHPQGSAGNLETGRCATAGSPTGGLESLPQGGPAKTMFETGLPANCLRGKPPRGLTYRRDERGMCADQKPQRKAWPIARLPSGGRPLKRWHSMSSVFSLCLSLGLSSGLWSVVLSFPRADSAPSCLALGAR